MCCTAGTCMKLGAPLSPGRGMAYATAPLQGANATAVATLLTRGAAADVNPSILQSISWQIQASTRPSDMPEEHQRVVHELIPDYEDRLNATGDFLQPVRDAYAKFRLVPGVPSFDSLISTLGAAGNTYLELTRKQQFLRQNALYYERIQQQFFDPNAPQQFTAGDSPWAEIRPGVLAQLVIEQGYAGQNRLNIRVLPRSSVQRASRPVFGIMPVAYARQAELTAPAVIITVGRVLGVTAGPVVGVAGGAVLGIAATGVLIAYAMNGVESQPQMVVMNSSEPQRQPYIGPEERQLEYEQAKNFCDNQQPRPTGNACADLSAWIDHAERCVALMNAWDQKWLPGRHDPKVATWQNRLQNLKDEHNRRCAQ